MWGRGMVSPEDLREAFKIDWEAKNLEERVEQHFSRWQEYMLWEKAKK
jgi:hypothetical protein